jgi:hypothetical protein
MAREKEAKISERETDLHGQRRANGKAKMAKRKRMTGTSCLHVNRHENCDYENKKTGRGGREMP